MCLIGQTKAFVRQRRSKLSSCGLETSASFSHGLEAVGRHAMPRKLCVIHQDKRALMVLVESDCIYIESICRVTVYRLAGGGGGWMV